MPIAPFLAPERDTAAKIGRPKEASVTYYTIPGVVTATATTNTLTTGFDAYTPFMVETPLIIDQAAIEVTTFQAASTARTGIYRSDANWQPLGAPIMESGTLDTSSNGVKTYTPGTPLYLRRGLYLTVYAQSNNAIAVRAYVGSVPGVSLIPALGTGFIQQLRASRAYAAFPTPGTAWTDANIGSGSTALQYRVVYRVSTP